MLEDAKDLCISVTDSCEDSQTNYAPTLSYRPRGSLARLLYDKQQADKYLSDLDKHQWYHCELTALPKSISTKFVQLGPDQDSARFLEASEEKSDWILMQIWHTIAKVFLGWFMTQTSINGWLQRGSMFVISTSQLHKLMQVDNTWHRQSLLDLGAGDGEVTAHLAPFFDDVYATEISSPMRALLTKRGYTVLDIEQWSLFQKYDMISCLNLLDRCDTPTELLQQIKYALKPDGLVLLAIVLPFSAYVESGSSDHKPSDLLPIVGSTFEDQVESVVTEVILPNGFRVVSWSRVPYLCEGDLKQSYYWLDDVIFILKSADS